MLSPACKQCKLIFCASGSGQMPIEYSCLPCEWKEGQVVVVADRPSSSDDAKGKLLNPEDLPGKQTRKMLDYLTKMDGLGLQWALTSVVRCGNNGSQPPTQEQYELCRVNFLNPSIAFLKPKIIVCLGLDAYKAVLGIPRDSKTKTTFPVKTPDGVWVIPSWEPPMDNKYMIETLKWISGIYAGTYDDVEFKYKRIHSRNEALEIAQSLPHLVVFDVETEQCNYVPSKLTLYGKDTCCFMYATTHKEGDSYVNYVYENQAVCAEVVREIMSRRTIVGHNITYDFAAVRRYFGVDGYKLVSHWKDTLLMHWLADQSSRVNDLKRLSVRNFLVEDHSEIIDQCVYEANIKKNEEEILRIEEENKKRTKLRKSELGLYTLSVKQKDKKINYDDSEVVSTLLMEILFERLGLSEQDSHRMKPLFPPTPSLGYYHVDRNIMAEYCAKDTFYTYRLMERLDSRPEEEQPTQEILGYTKKWSELLNRISRNGIPIDLDEVAKLKVKTSQKVKDILTMLIESPVVHAALADYDAESRQYVNVYHRGDKRGKKPDVRGIWQRITERVNPFSPHFCLAIIQRWNPEAFEWMEKTKKGSWSVNEETIERLANLQFDKSFKKYGHNFEESRTEVEWVWYYIYWYRKYRKILDEFLKKFVAYKGIDGNIHSTYTIHTAVTGRTNSKNPNLQNIKKDKAIRRCFKAPEGYMFAEIDFDRMEPTTLSVMVGIPAWKKIFKNNWDLYAIVANEVYKDELIEQNLWVDIDNLAASEVKSKLDRLKKERPELRAIAKVSTLAIIYGEEPRSFAHRAKRPLAEVETFYAKFFAAYPEIKTYMDKQKSLLNKGSFITTSFGRKRFFKRTGDRKTDKSLANQAINYPNQVDASDIALEQGVRLQAWLDKYHPDVLIINIVHDAYYLMVPQHKLEEVTENVMSIICDMSPFPFWDQEVPVRASKTVGKTLADTMD